MPGGKTHLNDKWLNKEDESVKGAPPPLKCKSAKGNTEVAYRTLCCKQFSISNNGFDQVKQHYKSSKHKHISGTRLDKALLKNC